MGFKGALDSKTTGQYGRYFSDISVEMIFYTATLIPNKPSEELQTHKKDLISKAKVMISWVEDINKFQPQVIESDILANLVVQPFPNGLYLIRIFKKEGVGLFGPLLDEMIVSKHILGAALRQTALHASRVCNSKSESWCYGQAFHNRFSLLCNIVNCYRQQSNSFSEIFGDQFKKTKK